MNIRMAHNLIFIASMSIAISLNSIGGDKMKRMLLIFILTLFALSACMDNKVEIDMSDASSFTGIIREVSMNSLMVMVNKDQDEYKSSDILSVSLDYKDRDTKINFSKGDPIRVYYNGMILESYPGQVTEVYKIEKIK